MHICMIRIYKYIHTIYVHLNDPSTLSQSKSSGDAYRIQFDDMDEISIDGQVVRSLSWGRQVGKSGNFGMILGWCSDDFGR